MGLVPIDATSGSRAAVLQAADSACYVAKDAGRDRIHIYTRDDAELAHRRGELQWISHLQEALEQDRFELYAQRIVPISQNAVSGIHCELLLRLIDAAGKPVSPAGFMPAAERYNLATRIDRWVVEHALRFFTQYPQHLAQLKLCTINLSGHSLGDASFQNFILNQLDRLTIPTKKVCFEITETAAITNFSVATHFIQALKARGCRFALDDFGSGLSSFGYLKNLPVDFLKIDGAFVKNIVDDPLDRAMVRSIHEIGHLMGKKTIAEHVENEMILNQLRLIGVDYAQGYGIGRPQPLAQLLAAK
jgi:EAL domain-containing protein (putative c-di-GMP-specific phosphodiesterase class I)